MLWRLCACVIILLIDRWVVGREQVGHGSYLVLCWHGKVLVLRWHREVGGGSRVRGLEPARVGDWSNAGEVSTSIMTRGEGHDPSISLRCLGS